MRRYLTGRRRFWIPRSRSCAACGTAARRGCCEPGTGRVVLRVARAGQAAETAGAVGHILRGWEAETGRPASDVPYWDAVAALACPPDMGWFPVSMAAQGRPDLTREVMLERRDAFLGAALSRLAAAG
jgi:hypothetical protein